MSFKYSSPNPHLLHPTPSHPPASSSVAGAVGMTTSGESESDDSEMGRLQVNSLPLRHQGGHKFLYIPLKFVVNPKLQE